ncbi:MAG: AEC family transporter [Burkholderiales bacterium]|nr:AEC family transporter [Burkholderiales bacterium]
MSNLLLLVACLAVGVLLQHSSRTPANAPQTLNAVILHVSLPAVTLKALHGFAFDPNQLWPVLMPWGLFAVGAAAFWCVGRWLRLPRASVGALTLVGGFGNTSFVGLPMIESLHGRDGLGLGLLIDQLGSYLALATIGVFVAALYAGDAPTSRASMLKKIVTFPPLIALALALSLRPLPFPAPLDSALARVGDTLAPLALLSVGLQLRLGALRSQARLLAIGLGYKLVACPAIVFAILWLLDAELDMTSRVSMIEAAMPPMIGAGIVAAEARLDAPLVSTMIGVGIPLGLVTATLWHHAFAHVLSL